jgi:hypothetical protein
MSGNVWECCLNEDDRPQRTGLSGTARRVVRGGSWGLDPDFARVISRRLRARHSQRQCGPAGGAVVPQPCLISVHWRPRQRPGCSRA